MKMRRYRGISLVGFALSLGMCAAALTQEPPLPPGLETPSAAREKDSPAEPPLPPGLGGDTEVEPALPPGLGGQRSEEPALPPGLGDEGRSEVAAPEAGQRTFRDRLPFPLHGFIDLRGGLRTQGDPAQSKTAVIGETRLQLKSEKAWDRAVFEVTADVIADAVMEEADFDLRQARLTWSITDRLDLRVGRQVLTWGTGDLLFINDLFPKDWPSFFVGRDVEYLKAPSDAAKLGWYTDGVNIEFVYTPQFAADRFITGERISFYNPLFDRFQGADRPLTYNAPSDWFSGDEFAWRLYRRLGNYEVAAYGFAGYWKSPGGQRLIPFLQAMFPRLHAYGASMRGPVGKGIFNAEIGYYDSRDDAGGVNPLINNSEFRVLLGYEREIGKNFTAGVQYYLEHMMDYAAYRNTRIFLIEPRDQDRHLFTLRLTKLLMEQNLTLSCFAYYSPSDGDAYLRPHARYKVNDYWSVELGGNIFAGESDASFFGQFKHNTNFYGALRWSF